MTRDLLATPTLSLVVPGKLRWWLAEAVYAEVRRLEETERATGPRRRPRKIKPPRSIADELRDLADTIRP